MPQSQIVLARFGGTRDSFSRIADFRGLLFASNMPRRRYFSPGMTMAGNLLTPDDQEAELRLVAETAREVWDLPSTKAFDRGRTVAL
ncbi:MAG: hypothetical protein LAN18_09870 [Acidobacteriia bacterium]|nr:hypothetical protein [Terriglobia bacterium]